MKRAGGEMIRHSLGNQLELLLPTDRRGAWFRACRNHGRVGAVEAGLSKCRCLIELGS